MDVVAWLRLCVVGSCWYHGGVLAAEVAPVWGVAPDERERYTGVKFECLDRKLSIPASQVNDDYCDCEDGSDEPGTAACAGLQTASQSWFYCPSQSGRPRYVYASHVDDGICDCCDGSDEWQHGGCDNNCEELGRAHRKQQQDLMEAMKRGAAKRDEVIAAVKGRAESWRQRLGELQVAVPDIRKEAEKTKFALVAAEERLQAQQAVANTEEESGSKQTVSEYAKWMEQSGASADQKDAAQHDRSIGRETASRREVSSVKIQSGDLVDIIEFVYRDGGTLVTGGGAGFKMPPFELEPDEGLIEIHGRQGDLLDSFEFVTSKGRRSSSYGRSTGGQPFALNASVGKYIIGLKRFGGNAGRIQSLLECDAIDRRTPEEIARDDAKHRHEQALQRVEDSEREVQSLEVKLQADNGKQIESNYGYFEDNCAKSNLDGYSYRVCLFERASQDNTELGRWHGWDPSLPHHALFKGGKTCFSGITRSLRVQIQCGENLALTRVLEPSQCVYEATMTHPAACDPHVLEAPPPARPILPHESHDEL